MDLNFKPEHRPSFRRGSTCADILEGLAKLEEDIYGWHYRINRDLTGFIDGSANSNFMEAAKIAIIPDSSPGQGGSVLFFKSGCMT